MNLLSCPFCGVASDVPHETQERCIAALHAEITRLRGIVDKVNKSAAPPEPPPAVANTAEVADDDATAH